MKNRSLTLFRLFVGVFVFSFLSVYIQAATIVSPNWNINNIDFQIRSLTTNYSETAAVIGGASKVGNATNNTLNINGLTVSAAADPQAAYNNGTDVVIGGAVYHAIASQNKVQVLNGSTIQGRTIMGGAALLDNYDNRLSYGTANNNTVFIKDSNVITDSFMYIDPETSLPITIVTGGNIIGGYANYANGTANSNNIIIDNSTVARDIYGSYLNVTLIRNIDYDEDGNLKVDINFTANNNNIQILNGSTVNGKVVGSMGGDNISGNTITIDASTVGSVYGAGNGSTQYNKSSSSAISTFTDNSIIIRNGSTIGNAYTVNGYSSNATNNKLIIDNSTVNTGFLRTVYMDLGLIGTDTLTPVNAAISENTISLNNIPTATTLFEIGAGLNLAGTANNHTTTLSNLSNLTVVRPLISFAALDMDVLGGNGTGNTEKLLSLKDLNDVVVSYDNFDSTYGFIYGGTALDYTFQVRNIDPTGGIIPEEAKVAPDTVIWANGGKEANGNTVKVSDSTINANIIGGFSAGIKEINYSTWAESTTTPGDFIKTETKKIGNEIIVTEYICDLNGQNCSAGVEKSRTNAEVSEDKFTANNNTVILDNANFNGTIYGGFVAGADLKIENVETSNNTVIIRGNTTLSPTSMLYGGNAYLGRTTNKLIFDHVSVAGSPNTYVTYNDAAQFQNFNSTWQVNADLNTRLDFAMNNVDAIVYVDNPSGQEGTATIIKTQTTSDLSDVDQNGVLTDLTDTSVELAQQKQGIYSYSLVGQKGNSNTVDWVLSVARDHQNVEVYGQVPLVGLALASEGQDMLSYALRQAWQSELDSSSFVDGAYHHTRYHTGSGFDLDSGVMQAGWWKKVDSDLLAGFFVKYAVGHYETFPIKATGTSNAFGGGLMTSYHYSETGRIEANVEVGYLDLEFKSSQLVSSLKTKGMYYGALVGLAQDLSSAWNVYGNLQYLRKGKDDLTDNLGQSISYETMQSLALRAGTELVLEDLTFSGIIPSVGASCIYEMDGKSKLDISGTSNDEASMKGFSARGEFGLTYKSEDTYIPMLSKLTLFGQGGKRSGFGGEVNISFKF